MFTTKWVRAGLVALIAAVPAGVVATQSAQNAEAAPRYTKTTLHFAVHVGANGQTACDVVGDLYVPTDASLIHRVPAILTTNGFGGSKNDQAGIGTAFAGRDYVVLSYSGLGFGGTGCKISLDDPDADGKAASQLISFLGGAPGIAFSDASHTKAVPRLLSVIHDGSDHAGVHEQYDPRVGMIGGSYGGEVQFAAAADDPRLDTIVPLITWNDLSYALAPNNANQTTGVSSSTPGDVKMTWGLFFTADGMADGVANLAADPSRLLPCPNFTDFVCPALLTGAAAGFFQPADVKSLQHASVASYLRKITIPVLLMQGENDTLFNLNEAVATYQALLKQRTPVKMVWQSWGHSSLTPAPGELNLNAPDPTTQYETARIAAWFDHYLKKLPTDTGPQFAYFRDWVKYTGIATPAYATASSYPVGPATRLYLSGGGQLVNSVPQATAASQNLFTFPAGLPSSLSTPDAVGSAFPLPDLNVPGTTAAWQSAALTHPLDVVGEPSLTVRVQAPFAAAAQSIGPFGELAMVAKIYDVGPDGKATLIHSLVAPFRVADVNKPIHIVLPGIAHQFGVGHRIEIMLAGGDLNYRGGLLPNMVTIPGGAGQVLNLPVVG